MRIKIEGPADFNRLAQIIQDLSWRSPPRAQIFGLNLYLTIRDEHGRLVELLNPKGEPIDVLTYSEDRGCVVPVRRPEEAPDRHVSRVVPFQRRAAGEKRQPDTEPPAAA